MKDIKTYIQNHYMITDGAMGTYFRQIYTDDRRASELANTENPEKIRAIHDAYIEAGARLIRTNSFAGNVQTLCGRPLRAYEQWEKPLKIVYENVYQAYQIAKEAAADHEDVWIAGDIGPVPEQGMIDDQEILAQYETMADALLDAGAEIILFETFADFKYIFPVIQYIRNQASPVIMVSFCLNKF